MKSWFAQGSSGRRVTLLPGTTLLHINGALGPIYMISGPETILPRVTVDEVTFSLFLCKINQLFTLGLQTRLVGRDNSGGRVVSPRWVG